MRFSAVRPAWILAVAVALPLAACASRPVSPTPGASPQAVVAPTMTIERFLRAVNQKDIDTMARLFGTRDGSVTHMWTQQEIDDRMFALAALLRHSDYSIGPEEIVPGRRQEAAMYAVTLKINDRTVQVPFTLVHSQRADGWLIEKIDVDRVTRGLR